MNFHLTQMHKNQNEIICTAWEYDKYELINTSYSTRIQLYKNPYISKLRFSYIDNSRDYMNVNYDYTTPTKKSVNSGVYKHNITKNTFQFTPTDSGWYYWFGKATVRNERTGRDKIYLIQDSFYVFR